MNATRIGSISSDQLTALEVAAHGPLSIDAISWECDMEPARAARLLDRLITRRYVTRAGALTTEGREALNAAHAKLAAYYAEQQRD